MATLFMSSLEEDRGGAKKTLTAVHRRSHRIHFIINTLLCWSHPLMSSHIGNKNLHSFALLMKDLSTHFLPKFPCYQVSNDSLFKSLNIPPNYWPLPMNGIRSYISPFLFSSKANNQVHCSKFCPLEGSSRTYGLTWRAACKVIWTCCRGFFCAGPHTKLAAFQVTQ